ncbi:MAG: His/Gly/Thr/Pro-type tRNA ligase C-terminal domain-containing protein [Myxococcota bacterium]|nr:His/Gly/Thr/Pro-type tRNA ligase C-terminal domain-containing protein [Myxococcota bacterium]
MVGIPFRVTVGPKGLDNGVGEVKSRRTGETRDLPLDHAAVTVGEWVLEERR